MQMKKKINQKITQLVTSQKAKSKLTQRLTGKNLQGSTKRILTNE